MLRIVVTGGSGFIGAHVVDRLVAAGHHVGVIDVRAPQRDDVVHWPVSLDDLDGLVAATRGADVVFHLAAVADVNDAADDPVRATEVNVSGTARVWEACRINGVGRAVLASTVWVYGGAAGEGEVDENATFDLAAAGHVYTASKLGAELVVHSYHTLYDQPFTILRYGIPYGPGMRPSLVIARFVRLALEGAPITIEGDGSQYRNYVYVEDLADAHVLALQEEARNEVFNLEGTEPVTIRKLVDDIGALLERPLLEQHLPARTGDYDARPVSAAKAARVLGWTPQVPFAEGLRRYYDWYVQHVPGPAPATVAGHEVEPRRDDRPHAVRALAGLGLAIAALPVLALSMNSSITQVLLALLGTLIAAGTVWFLSRRGAPVLPVAVAVCVLVAAIWLVTQATPGAISLVLGLLVGLGVSALAPASFAVSRNGIIIGAVAGVALIIAANIDRDTLFIPAAILALALALAARYMRLPEWAHVTMHESRAWSVPVVSSIVLLTLATAVWTGGTSPSAAWFGRVTDHGSRGQPEVALTFDGNAAATTNARVLAILAAAHVRATFFENGQTIESRPALARAIVSGGNLLANRSWNDSGTQWLDPRARALSRAQLAFAQKLRLCPAFFRPPHGRHTPFMAREAHSRGMRMVTWDVRVAERAHEDPGRFTRALLARVRPGSIVALDLAGRPGSGDPIAQALPRVLAGIRARGLEPVRLDTLLGATGYTPCGPSGRASPT